MSTNFVAFEHVNGRLCERLKADNWSRSVKKKYYLAIRMLESYLQCSPPPKFDAFPQSCSSSVDCFPNLCCAEGGKKHCRPPQRSFLSLLAGAAQRFG